MPTKKQRKAFMLRAKERREAIELGHKNRYIWAKILVHLRRMPGQGPKNLLLMSQINKASREAVVELLPDRVWWYSPHWSKHMYSFRVKIYYLRYLHFEGPPQNLPRKIRLVYGSWLHYWYRTKSSSKSQFPVILSDKMDKSKRNWSYRKLNAKRYSNGAKAKAKAKAKKEGLIQG